MFGLFDLLLSSSLSLSLCLSFSLFVCSENGRNAWHKVGASAITIVHLLSNWDAGASSVSYVRPYSAHSFSSVYNNPHDIFNCNKLKCIHAENLMTSMFEPWKKQLMT